MGDLFPCLRLLIKGTGNQCFINIIPVKYISIHFVEFGQEAAELIHSLMDV